MTMPDTGTDRPTAEQLAEAPWQAARGVLKVPPGSPPPEVVIRVIRGDLQALTEWQRAMIDHLWPVARAAVAVAGWWRTLDAGLRDPETPRDVLDDYTNRYDNALDLLGQAISELPDDVAADLEKGDADADRG